DGSVGVFPYSTLFRSVRRGAVLGVVEVAVGNRLGVGRVVGVGVHVGHVAVQRLAAHGEGGGVEHVQRAGLQLGHGGRHAARVRQDRKSTRLNSSHVSI